MQVFSKLKSLASFYKIDIHNHHFQSKKNTLHMTGASCLGSLFVGVGKMMMGILSMSFFTCASSLYTFAIVLAKVYVLYGLSQTQKDVREQYAYYKRSGKLLFIAGIAYILYSIKLWWFPTDTYFDQNMALSIAFFTFVELGLNIRGIIVERKQTMPLFHALKIINLASSCICLVLTQTALLSYTEMQTSIPNNSSSNGIIGVLMGIVSALLGVYLIIRANRITTGKDVQVMVHKIKRWMKKKKISYTFEVDSISMNKEGNRVMVIQFLDEIGQQQKIQFFDTISQAMKIVLIEKHDTINM